MPFPVLLCSRLHFLFLLPASPCHPPYSISHLLAPIRPPSLLSLLPHSSLAVHAFPLFSLVFFLHCSPDTTLAPPFIFPFSLYLFFSFLLLSLAFPSLSNLLGVTSFLSIRSSSFPSTCDLSYFSSSLFSSASPSSSSFPQATFAPVQGSLTVPHPHSSANHFSYWQIILITVCFLLLLFMFSGRYFFPHNV